MYFEVQNKTMLLESNTGHHLTGAPHVHHHIEIVLMYEGQSTGVADDKEGVITPDSLYIAMPNQIHWYSDTAEQHRHALVILSPTLCPEFSGIFKSFVPESPVLNNIGKDPTVRFAIENLVRLHHVDEESDAATEVRGYALILFSALFRQMKLVENKPYDYDLARDIISFCYENYTEDISLHSISEALHVSRYYVSHLFANRLHIRFPAYINSLRIKKACDMLKQHDLSVTEISYAVGYNSPRTFDRCFLAQKGVTPKQYRIKALQQHKT